MNDESGQSGGDSAVSDGSNGYHSDDDGVAATNGGVVAGGGGTHESRQGRPVVAADGTSEDADSDSSTVMVSGNSPFVPKSARYNFLQRSGK